MTRPPICLSQSRLKPLWLCPYNFIQTYGLSGENADYGADSSEDANIGTILHALDAQNGEHCWKVKRKSDWVYFDRLCRAAMEKIPEHRRLKAQDVADRIKDSSLIDLKADNYMFERRFAFAWPDYTACKPGAQIDRFEGTFDKISFHGDRAVIRDSKMGWSRNAGQFTEDVFDDLQLMCYALMAFHLWPDLQQVDCWLDFMAYGGKNTCGGSWTRETIETHQFNWYGTDLTIRQLLDASFVRAGNLYDAHGHLFPAVRPDGITGHHDVCRWCRLACPAWLDIKERRVA